MAAGIFAASAQDASRAAYFLEGYNYRHEMNPALAPERGYVAMPVLGNLGIGTQANIGVNTLIYKKPDGQLTTFMNKSVSSSEFLGNLSKTNKLLTGVNLNIISLGFKGFGGYNTLGISVKADVGMSLPKGLFEFMKVGQTGPNTRYDFGDMRLRVMSYAEVALGHQRQVTPELAAGVKVKFLLGLAHLDANIKKMDVSMGDKKWVIDGDGEIFIGAGNGLYVPTNAESGKELDKPSRSEQIDFDGIEYNNFGLAGFGMAFDLGATYDMSRFVDGLRLSAAVTDLGFIKWNGAAVGRMPGRAWEFDGFQDIAIDDTQDGYDDNKIDQQLEDLGDRLVDCLNFEKQSQKESETRALHATLTIGAEYDMPFYKRLSAGVLFTQRMAGCFSWTEGRFSANVKPTNWFDATVSYGASTFGSSFGWMLNFHPKGFNFFVGSDHQFFKITPQFVPVGHLNTNIQLGINFTFGGKYKGKPIVKG